MKKYVLSMLLALCLIAALLPGTPAAAEDGHGTNPVSYTHLDVYKRQSIVRSRT